MKNLIKAIILVAILPCLLMQGCLYGPSYAYGTVEHLMPGPGFYHLESSGKLYVLEISEESGGVFGVELSVYASQVGGGYSETPYVSYSGTLQDFDTTEQFRAYDETLQIRHVGYFQFATSTDPLFPPAELDGAVVFELEESSSYIEGEYDRAFRVRTGSRFRMSSSVPEELRYLDVSPLSGFRYWITDSTR